MNLNTRNKLRRAKMAIEPALLLTGITAVGLAAAYYKGKSNGKVVVLVGADDEGKLQTIEF